MAVKSAPIMPVAPPPPVGLDGSDDNILSSLDGTQAITISTSFESFNSIGYSETYGYSKIFYLISPGVPAKNIQDTCMQCTEQRGVPPCNTPAIPPQYGCYLKCEYTTCPCTN